MIGGLLDGLMGKVNYRAQAPNIDTGRGRTAINAQAGRGSEQALAQSYALANSGRGGGGSQALALREAQRRGAEASANLQGQAVTQTGALEQAAVQQRAQQEMQAQQINAGIAQQEAGGMKQLVSAGLLAGALMSDYRQKEMISDFETKEPAAPMLGTPVAADPNAQSNRVALDLARQQAAAMMQQPAKQDEGILGGMLSDQRAKEKAYSAGVRAGSMRSPMTPGYGPPLQPAASSPGYGQPRPMVSDFQQKEDLDPVRPTLYRYNPESSERQAIEAAQQTYANTLEDKRAPREGIVAQDLQQSPAFAGSVVEKDDGQLAIDRDRALSTALAELGQMHQRVKRLEGRRGA